MSQEITVADDLSVHVVSADGSLEFFLPNYDPETFVAFTSEEQATACAIRLSANPNVWSPYKSPEEREQEALDGQWKSVRAERNQRLADCDWTQLPDAPVDAEAWATYRQDLRDITTQPDPFNIVWPETPA